MTSAIRLSRNAQVSENPEDRSASGGERRQHRGAQLSALSAAPVIMNTSVAENTAASVARLVYQETSEDVSPGPASQRALGGSHAKSRTECVPDLVHQRCSLAHSSGDVAWERLSNAARHAAGN